MINRAFGLATDLYELTMAAAYFDNDAQGDAIFELFVRSLPKRRSYLIVAGLEQALDYLHGLRFTGDEIDYLRHNPSFKNVSQEFFDYLREFRFTGDVWAMPEGSAAFAMEPLLRVKAPVIEAQIVETFLLTTINFQTLIASKAARIVTAAKGRSVVEFGTRRAHGSEAGMYAARAAYIAGCSGTSNVEAGYLFGIPVFGTLAHSFIMAFEEEDDAFRAFLKVFRDTATALLDTYDTIAAVERLARDFGPTIPAVRLDSGDLLDLSKRVRQILDRAAMTETKIFASGDLDEYVIADLLAQGAPIDAFGVGTQLSTSYDSPALGGVYKLAGISLGGRIAMRVKLSAGKATYPGPKQVWRASDATGKYVKDIVSLADETQPDILDEQVASLEPLLVPVMNSGKPVADYRSSGSGKSSEQQTAGAKTTRLATLNRARERAAKELKRLPSEILALNAAATYSVGFSRRLEKEREAITEKIISERK